MLSRIASRGAALSAFAMTVALLTAAGRPSAAPRAPVAPHATRDTAAVTTATLQVQNNALSNRTVYVTMGGVSERLGTATAASTTDFTIPRTYVTGSNPVRFITNRFASSRSEESQRMQIFPGDTLDLVIQGL